MSKLKHISTTVTKRVEFEDEDGRIARIYWNNDEASEVQILSGEPFTIDFKTALFLKQAFDAGILTCPQDDDHEHPRETGWLHTDGH